MRRALGCLIAFLGVVIALAVVWVALRGGVLGGRSTTAAPTPTPIPTQRVFVASRMLPPGTLITDDMLQEQLWPVAFLPPGAVFDRAALVGKLTVTYVVPGQVFVQALLADPGAVQGGSMAASLLQPGEVAVAIPMDKYSGLAYGLRPGDFVDLILGLLVVDVDQTFQSRVPNDLMLLTQDPETGQYRFVPVGTGGRVETIAQLGVPVYVMPQERQRPRLVTQLTVQRARVLHLGPWPLLGAMLLPEPGSGYYPGPEPAAAPSASGTPVPTPTTRPPDVVTLAVSPQDAVAISFMLMRGAKLTMVLRNPDDTSLHDTQAVSLDYITAVYGVPVPARLPYDLARPADYGLPPTPTPTPIPPED